MVATFTKKIQQQSQESRPKASVEEDYERKIDERPYKKTNMKTPSSPKFLRSVALLALALSCCCGPQSGGFVWAKKDKGKGKGHMVIMMGGGGKGGGYGGGGGGYGGGGGGGMAMPIPIPMPMCMPGGYGGGGGGSGRKGGGKGGGKGGVKEKIVIIP